LYSTVFTVRPKGAVLATRPVAVRLSDEEIARLDAHARELDRTRQWVMRKLLTDDRRALTAAAAVAQLAGQLTAQALREAESTTGERD